MNTELSLSRSLKFAASLDQLRSDIFELQPVLEQFPRLACLEKTNDRLYRWQLEPVGSMGVRHALSYSATYNVADDGLQVEFTSLPNEGNANLRGCFVFKDVGEGRVAARVELKGELRDINIPKPMKDAAPDVLGQIFDQLLGRFLENLKTRYTPT